MNFRYNRNKPITFTYEYIEMTFKSNDFLFNRGKEKKNSILCYLKTITTLPTLSKIWTIVDFIDYLK